jgi:hypothetical protein
MRCPNCGYEIGPFCNAAGTAPSPHNCVLPTNAAAAMPLFPPICCNWYTGAACAPQFTGLIYPLVLP